MLSRTFQAMAYDSDRQVVVMFGGTDAHVTTDTWEWDGTQWSSQHTPTTPDMSGVMVYDSTRKRMVMFGPALISASTFPPTLESQTWEYDGTTWQQILTAHNPPALGLQGFAYDSDRRLAVLFGGEGFEPGMEVDDTWEYDGVDWYQRHPATSPGAGGGTAMVYDAARKKTFLFGGGSPSTNDTWEYDGSNWSQLVLAQSPPARRTHAMVYDSLRQKVVVYGGQQTGNSTDLAGDDTWEWDGSSWTQVNAMGLPGGRIIAIAAYDAARGQMVLHGGTSDWGDLADTWLWNGANWTSGDLGAVPAPHAFAGLAYDSNRQRVVMFGGGSYVSAYEAADTFEWNGSLWSRVASVGPDARTQAPMAFDSARNVTVLFGGAAGVLTFADTWEWDGSSWTQRMTAHGPQGRWDNAIGYDSTRQRTVIFGGVDSMAWVNGPMSDTWEYDGTDWVVRTPATTVPPARHGASMAFDSKRGQMVMFGGTIDTGNSNGSNTTLADTWLWDGNDWTLAAPATSPPGRHHAALAFDSKRALVVMFGGLTDEFALGDQWEWDGTTWSLHTPASEPRAYGGATLAYDASRDEFVMFGGSYRPNIGSSDTWLYVPPP